MKHKIIYTLLYIIGAACLIGLAFYTIIEFIKVLPELIVTLIILIVFIVLPVVVIETIKKETHHN